jgi:hypothetical protein
VEHLVRQVYSAFGVEYKKREEKKEERVPIVRKPEMKEIQEGDDFAKDIDEIDEDEDLDSDDDMDEDDEIKDNPADWGVRNRESEDYKNTSNYVSTIRNPSFG